MKDRQFIGERGFICNDTKGVYNCDNCKYGCKFKSTEWETVSAHEEKCPFDPVKSAQRAARATVRAGYTDKEWRILGA